MESFDLRDWPGFAEAGGDLSSRASINQITIDSRRIYSPSALFVPLPGSRCDGHRFIIDAATNGARYALVCTDFVTPRGLDQLLLLRVNNPLSAFQEITKAYRQQQRAQVIAIAGSYGKTMVKDLLHAMLTRSKRVVASPESFNSQIGVPLSLLQIHQEHEIALIEAGISQTGEMDILSDLIAPDKTIVTAIGSKHIATLGSLQTTAAEIAKLLPSNDWSLLPRSPLLEPHLSQARPIFWNEASPDLPHARTLSTEQSTNVPYEIAFPDGNHFEGIITGGHEYCLDLINITTKAAWQLGAPSEDICATLENFAPEPIRTEIWQSPMGVTFINDTYCSDPQSVDLALRHFEQCHHTNRKIFIFGGIRGTHPHLEKDYQRIGKALAKAKLDKLILVGKHPYRSLMNEISDHIPEVTRLPGDKESIQHLKSILKPGDTVLIKGEKKESLDRFTEVFYGSVCTNECFINLAAVASNLTALHQKLSQKTRVMVMVKASAYGTHDALIAKFLKTKGVDILGVSYVDEGIALRNAGVTQSIFSLHAAPYEASKVVEWEFEVGVCDREAIKAIGKEAKQQGKKIKVHLHVDTGMNRLGCRPEDTLALAQYIRSFPSLELEGILTHFACADDPGEDHFTLSQTNQFDRVIGELKSHNIIIPWHHAANSSGVMRFNFSQYNMVRIGLALYGLMPFKAAQEVMPLRLALSLTSRIVGINLCKKGETISYGRKYTVQDDNQRFAVIPVGYFDGLHRSYSGKGQVIIRGHRAPMVGSICMDYMMVDISNIPLASIGDRVLIFGEDSFGNHLPPEELAEQGNSFVYELVTCLGPRIQRIFIHEENPSSC